MRFVYKDIHFGAIATFYIIALLVRPVSSHSNMGVGFSGIHLCRGVWRYL